MVWTGLIWLKKRTGGRLLWTWLWALGYFKIFGEFFSSSTIDAFSRRVQLHEVSWCQMTGHGMDDKIQKDLDGKRAALIKEISQENLRKTMNNLCSCRIRTKPTEYYSLPPYKLVRCVSCDWLNQFAVISMLLYFMQKYCVVYGRSLIFSQLSLVWKIKWGLWYQLAVCLSVFPLI
jgi:hypothetical protein